MLLLLRWINLQENSEHSMIYKLSQCNVVSRSVDQSTHVLIET